MSLMLGRLYDALKAAGADDLHARLAAEEVYAHRAPRPLYAFWRDHGWLVLIAVSVWIFALMLIITALSGRAAPVGEAVRPAGRDRDLSIIERPETCVYIYANANGVGITAMAKPAGGC